MADILIKGMEMPTKGYRLILVHADGTVQTTSGETTAVSVQPHGDLIDRDALKNKHHWTDDFYETEYVEVEDIDAAPTIIPADGKDIKVPTREEGE